MNIENVAEFIDPSLAILVPCLWGVGMAVKKSPLDNKYIPLILFFVSNILARVKILPGVGCSRVELAPPIFAAVTQGSVAWLTAWLGYENFLHTEREKHG
jgi:hypothetical protein